MTRYVKIKNLKVEIFMFDFKESAPCYVYKMFVCPKTS